jgi:hypothetical protein
MLLLLHEQLLLLLLLLIVVYKQLLPRSVVGRRALLLCHASIWLLLLHRGLSLRLRWYPLLLL